MREDLEDIIDCQFHADGDALSKRCQKEARFVGFKTLFGPFKLYKPSHLSIKDICDPTNTDGLENILSLLTLPTEVDAPARNERILALGPLICIDNMEVRIARYLHIVLDQIFSAYHCADPDGEDLKKDYDASRIKDIDNLMAENRRDELKSQIVQLVEAAERAKSTTKCDKKSPNELSPSAEMEPVMEHYELKQNIDKVLSVIYLPQSCQMRFSSNEVVRINGFMVLLKQFGVEFLSQEDQDGLIEAIESICRGESNSFLHQMIETGRSEYYSTAEKDHVDFVSRLNCIAGRKKRLAQFLVDILNDIWFGYKDPERSGMCVRKNYVSLTKDIPDEDCTGVDFVKGYIGKQITKVENSKSGCQHEPCGKNFWDAQEKREKEKKKESMFGVEIVDEPFSYVEPGKSHHTAQNNPLPAKDMRNPIQPPTKKTSKFSNLSWLSVKQSKQKTRKSIPSINSPSSQESVASTPGTPNKRLIRRLLDSFRKQTPTNARVVGAQTAIGNHNRRKSFDLSSLQSRTIKRSLKILRSATEPLKRRKSTSPLELSSLDKPIRPTFGKRFSFARQDTTARH